MSEFRGLIEELVAKGVDAIDAADIIHRATALGAATAPKQRTPGALRQERYRERHKGVTVTECDGSDAPPVLDKEKVAPKETKPTPLISPTNVGVSPAEIEKAIEVYSETAARSGLPVPRAITPQRRRKIAGVLRQHGLDAWTEAVQRMGSSEFCCGQNDRSWRADLDFLLQPTSFMRLIEGQYGGSAATNSGGDTFCASDDPSTRFHVMRFRNEHDGADPPNAAIGGKAGFMIPATWVKAMQMRQANG